MWAERYGRFDLGTMSCRRSGPAHYLGLGPAKEGAIQFAVTKLFGTGSQVSFFAAIIQRYRKFM
jgi:hypothetical protein